MKSNVKIAVFIFLLFIVTFSLINITKGYAYNGETGQQNFSSLMDRYNNDEEFRFFANFTLVALVSLVVLVVLASFFGIGQLVLWSFIGGFLGANAVELILSKYMGFGFGPFSFYASFTAGIACAIYAQTRSSR